VITSARGRVFLGLTIGLAALITLVVFLQKRSGYYRDQSTLPLPSPEASAAPTLSPPSTSSSPEPGNPTPIESAPPTPENLSSPSPPPPSIGFVGTLKLIVPVTGVRADQLRDTFSDSRSEGRVHDAIDIPAPPGTPVLAAADGKIVKLFQSECGGTTIYQSSTDNKLIFYYAHLQSYANAISEGKLVRQGDVIGYVGDTGNAGAGNYHLHFSIAVVADPKRYWEGANINPYPLLRN